MPHSVWENGTVPGPVGYPSRRGRPEPMDNPAAYPKPPAAVLPESLQMTAASPPRPSIEGPSPEHFQPGTIPGESPHNARSG
jgi:hypothetical protein